MFPRLAAIALALVTLAAVAAPSEAAARPKLILETSQRAAASRGPNGRPVAWTVDTAIWSDGSFMVGARRGQLTASERRELTRAIGRTRFVLERAGRPMCAALPTHQIRVRTATRSLSWSAPCARGAHPSVLALTDLAARLTRDLAPTPEPPPEPRLAPAPEPSHPAAAPATLVAYRVTSWERLDDGRSDIVVAVDGSWRAGGRAGTLAPSDLKALGAQLRAARFAASKARPEPCAARLGGEATLVAPDVGSFSWSTPCGNPDPSLGALLTTLRRLTR